MTTRFSSLIICTTALLCSAAVGLADMPAGSVMDQFMKNPDMPVILRGDYFRAVQAAFGDFSKVLVKRAAEGSPIPKVENYDIHIEQTATTFVVWFRPTMRDPDKIVMGGGVTYTIDRSTFSIARKVFSK